MGFVSKSAFSTIGVGGGEEGEGSFDPVDGWTIRNLETSANSFSQSEEEKGSSLLKVSSVCNEEVSSDSERCDRIWDEYWCIGSLFFWVGWGSGVDFGKGYRSETIEG